MTPEGASAAVHHRRRRRIEHPGVLVVAAFAVVIIAGSILLALPVSHRSSVQVSTGEAAFTATSAVTVTGLVVTDTRTVWSPFGETVIIVLIQLGGLGIMTLAGFFAIALNRRLGVRTGLLAGAELGLTQFGVVRSLIRDIVRFVAASELAITALLFARFLTMEDTSWPRALHLAVFHAVSAFNNAGFSIFDGGLERFVSDWYVNVVIAGAFIVGGLGFPVVFELRRRWRHPRRWSLHTKVTLSMTLALLLGGAILIAATEWTNGETLGSLGVADKTLAATFQSATARTAGFNTVPIGELRPGSWMVLILLMVIGAGSASTGGGIKASTFAVVIRATLSEFRQDQSTTLFERRVSLAIQRQALALVVAALVTVGTATFVLSLFDANIPTIELLFEASSAFGTVGISTGVTEQLDAVGRMLLIVLMFIGRIGPITFGTAVFTRIQAKQYDYAEETLLVG